MQPRPDQVIDFYQEWGSAHNYWMGLPVYTPHSTSIPRYLGLPANPIPAIEYNIHPPTSVLLVLPLGRVDYPHAVFIWNLVSLMALMVSLVMVTVILATPWWLRLPALAMLPFCHPVYGNLYQGQLNLLLVLLITMVWVFERSNWSKVAGTVLGAAAAIKLFPIYLVVYYVAQRRGRPLLATFVSFASLTLLTALVLGVDTYKDYLTIVLPWNAEFHLLGFNLSIAGLWYKLFHPVLGEGIVPIWSSIAVARWGSVLSNLAITTVVAVLGYRAQSSVQRDLAFAVTLTAMLLVSPVTWDVALPILLVPFALIARSSIIAQSRWLLAGLLLILIINCIPQHILVELALAGHSTTHYSWVFMLGAPSLKFYTLMGTFLLVLIAFYLQATKPRPRLEGEQLVI
jgi:alpha-1,2-mannosyltransferase